MSHTKAWASPFIKVVVKTADSAQKSKLRNITNLDQNIQLVKNNSQKLNKVNAISAVCCAS